MANTGTTVVDFGAFPGSSDTTATVTGQASILAGSLVEAWVMPTATADHSADEHWVEPIKVMAGNVVAGTGFTIYATMQPQTTEPLTEYGQGRNHVSTGTAAANTGYGANTLSKSVGGKAHRLYGQFTVAWVWV